MENQAEYYYEKLKNAINSGQVLLQFYSEITGREAGRAEIIMINKLIKLFGRFIVYFSIMDLSRYDKLEGEVYPLLYTICRSRFEKVHNDVFTGAYASLDRQVASLEKEIEKNRLKKINIPDSKGLDNAQ